VWSRPVPRTATPVELGAEFIHGPGELTMLLLREAGMAAVDTGGEEWMCSEDGELRREDSDLSSFARIVEAAGALADDESVDRFLRRFKGDEAMREPAAAARAFVEGFDAADPASASARAISDRVTLGSRLCDSRGRWAVMGRCSSISAMPASPRAFRYASRQSCVEFRGAVESSPSMRMVAVSRRRFMREFRYKDRGPELLSLPVNFIATPFPLDFRSREQVRRDAEEDARENGRREDPI